MARPAAILLQILCYAAFAGLVGWLSSSPSYEYASAEHTTLKVALSHAAKRVVPCVRRTPAEIAAMPPNMRQPEKCERERMPVVLELEIDGEAVYSVVAPPSGLWGDGPASIYHSFQVEPGEHRIDVRLRDGRDENVWDYTYSEDVVLQPGRYFTITFRGEGFELR